jgi:hypothetical protein
MGGAETVWWRAVDDRALLRDLTAAIRETEGHGAQAQAAAIFAVLARHGATEADVRRLLGRARDRRGAELRALRSKLDVLIEEREDAEATADAVDRFLREHGI